MLLVNWLKKQLKRSDTFVSLYVKLCWKIHLLKDWWGTKVWKKTTEVMTPLGFKLTSGFHPAYQLMREGTFEVEETALIKQSLKQIDCFIDVGANLGYYTCLALKHGKKTISFEPQPQNLRCLFQNLMANGWQDQAEVYPVALSDKAGLLTLYGASGPSASLIKGWAGYSSRHQQIVPVSTLDNVIGGRLNGKKLFVKIDVEGAEYQVLKGASITLAHDPKPIWLLEVCLDEFHPLGRNPDYESIFKLFFENGYQAYSVGEQVKHVTREDIDQWVGSKSCDVGTYNFVFIESGSDLEKVIS